MKNIRVFALNLSGSNEFDTLKKINNPLLDEIFERYNSYIDTLIDDKRRSQAELSESKDQVKRRNMQIRELKKRMGELEAFNNTFGDKRD